MSKKAKKEPALRSESGETFRPAKGVVIRSGAHRGRTVYGIPEYTVRLLERYGDLISSYLKREMATPEMREATQDRSPAEIEAIRTALFWWVFKQIEPRLHVEALDASIYADHCKGIKECKRPSSCIMAELRAWY